MDVWKTQQDVLSPEEINEWMYKNDRDRVPRLHKLWRYYRGDNTKIMDKPKPDPNNPDNRTPVPYARKIVTTFTGYAYRPGYITYKAKGDEAGGYVEQLQETFRVNNEHLKTYKDGRNTAIYGVSYELLYIENNEPRFTVVDPRNVVLLYDYALEPNIKIGIYYYRITDSLQKVEVYYPDRIELYDRVKSDSSSRETGWKIMPTETQRNFFGAVPMVAYYLGDDKMGLIEPVLPLIDDYDLLTSDSLNEFDRFAHAYLRLVGMGLVPPQLKKEPGAFSRVLRNLKRLRVFENLPSADAVSFLTKDIPTEFVQYMSQMIREQIHVQSHVPDFTSERLASGISGVAVQRLMFDFENVVSNAEAELDTGIYQRIELMNRAYQLFRKETREPSDVSISHKRNMPLNLTEFAENAVRFQQAGFSRYLTADIMPDDIIPDIDAELDRQREEQEAMLPDLDTMTDEQV